MIPEPPLSPVSAAREAPTRLIDLTAELLIAEGWRRVRHHAADRGEHEPGGERDRREPEPEPEPLTLNWESTRLIAGSIRRDPYELLPEADPPA